MKSVRSQLIFALTGDIDIRNTYWSKDLQDMGHDLAMCLGESSVVLSIPWPITAPVTGYIASLSAAVSKLTNTIAALRYLGDDIILASLTNFYASAYDKCEFEELDVEDDDDTGPTDDTPIEEWQCAIYGAPGSKAISAAVSSG